MTATDAHKGHEEALNWIDERAHALSQSIGNTLLEAMEKADRDGATGDGAMGLTLFTHTLAELVGQMAGTTCVVINARHRTEEAFDSFVKIALRQIAEGAAARRNKLLDGRPLDARRQGGHRCLSNKSIVAAS